MVTLKKLLIKRVVSLLEIMRTFDAGFFVILARLIENYRQNIPAGKTGKVRKVSHLTSTLERYRRSCLEYGLTVSADFARDILLYLDVSTLDAQEAKSLIEQLQRATDSELQAQRFFHLPKDKLHYFEAENLFGEEVGARFPSTITDIEEAGRCFALSRYTASAFHCMRAVEVGLKAIGRHLQIARVRDDSWSWEKVLTEILQAIQKNRAKKPKPKLWKQRDPFLVDAHAHLHALRKAWRNPTMHTVRTYNEEQAHEIFQAARGFMRHLSEHLDESGKWIPG